MITATQKHAAEAIVNVFETGSVRGDYGGVTLIEGDTGHLTFGRSQTTLGSGNLHKLLSAYCDNPGARFGPLIAPFLPRCATPLSDFSLDHEKHLHNVLRASADDPVMRETQDIFFDTAYWQPAQRAALQFGISTPLGVAVVYDSRVHGSWKQMHERTTHNFGSIQAIGERAWIAAYIQTRRQWLATHPRRDLRATVYRMEVFQGLIDYELWGLELPLVVRGHEISLSSLRAPPRNSYDGPQPGSRPLALQAPLLRGQDVRLLQLGLSRVGFDIKADGVFGQGSLNAVKSFQHTNGLPATGVVDAALIAQLIA